MNPPRSRFPHRRQRLSALAAGLAAVGAVALASPASAAANADVTATLRVTTHSGDSIMTQTNGAYTCHRNVTPGQAKDIVVTVPDGQWVQVFATDGCYGVANGSLITGVNVASGTGLYVINV